MPIGPNEDGAELYRMHLESLPCPTCGAKESERAALAAAIAERDALREAVEWACVRLGIVNDPAYSGYTHDLCNEVIAELRRRADAAKGGKGL